VLNCSMEDFENRYAEVIVKAEHAAAARALRPMHERQLFGRSVFLFDRANRGDGAIDAQLDAVGEVRTPSIADLFVAIIGGQEGAKA
jgi:ABC-2 type transport system ATP-binding protein